MILDSGHAPPWVYSLRQFLPMHLEQGDNTGVSVNRHANAGLQASFPLNRHALFTGTV
jgi:hypothetical protein